MNTLFALVLTIGLINGDFQDVVIGVYEGKKACEDAAIEQHVVGECIEVDRMVRPDEQPASDKPFELNRAAVTVPGFLQTFYGGVMPTLTTAAPAIVHCAKCGTERNSDECDVRTIHTSMASRPSHFCHDKGCAERYFMLHPAQRTRTRRRTW